MKRIILSIIILVIGLAQSDAKLPRTFFGIPFGASKQEVLEQLISTGYNTIEHTPTGFRVNSDENHIDMVGNPVSLSFRDYEWDSVDFIFFQEKLFEVTFKMSAQKKSEKLVGDTFYEFLNKFAMEYRKYIRSNANEAFIFNDKRTEAYCKLELFDQDLDFDKYSVDKIYAQVRFSDYKVTKKMRKAKKNKKRDKGKSYRGRDVSPTDV